MAEIRDERLGVYFIVADEFSYIVKKDTGKFSTDKKSGETKPIYENKGYYSNKLGAFNRIKDLQLNEEGKSYSIKEYFEESNRILREFISLIEE